jgi:phosphoribosyl-ATP pyrophosphohydrolase/phosphoribosyl-AMP cyclohydrolase/histidinol dehydrogenase
MTLPVPGSRIGANEKVVADSTANPKFVASDLLSQAEHGADSTVVLVAVDLSTAQLKSVEDKIHRQASLLPRGSIIIKALANSSVINFDNLTKAMDFTNDYSPEHLILYISESGKVLDLVQNAGSVFVGSWSPVSCGDYASGMNHVPPQHAQLFSVPRADDYRPCGHTDSQRCIVE